MLTVPGPGCVETMMLAFPGRVTLASRRGKSIGRALQTYCHLLTTGTFLGALLAVSFRIGAGHFPLFYLMELPFVFIDLRADFHRNNKHWFSESIALT